MTPPTEDDPIADAILSDDPEQVVRYGGVAFTAQWSPADKLRALGVVAAACAAAVLALVHYGAEPLRADLGVADPLSASVTSGVLIAAGLAFVTVGGVGLSAAIVLRRRVEITERNAQELLALEEVSSLVGLVTGSLGTAAGLTALAWIVAANSSVGPPDVGPAQPAPVPVTFELVVLWGVGLAGALLVASAVAEAHADDDR